MTAVLLHTSDATIERAVAAARPGTELLTCRDAASLAVRLGENGARLVLMDLEPDQSAALNSLAGLASRFPEARFVVLCRELSADVLLAAMQAGARHGLRRDTLGAELPGVVQRLTSDLNGHSSGQIVTVLSASGGCGCTTVAIALAEELRRGGDNHVLLVDLDQHYGAMAAYLGLKGSYGVADVLARAGTIDAQLVSSTAVAYGEGFHVLLSPAAVNASEPKPLDWKRLPELLDASRQSARFTVLDASRVPPAAAAALVNASALSLLVMELAVVDIRSAHSMLQALRDRGTGDDLVPVANRFLKRQTAPGLQDARDALSRDIETIANDFPAALRALNHGQPVPRSAPKSALCEDVRRLAARILPQSVVSTPSRGR